MTTPRFAPGTFTPAPGPGRPLAMLVAQAGIELRLALRGGEQVLLTLLIPTALLIGLTLVTLVPLPDPRVAAVTPGVLALAVMSTAFTAQAIALGFDRRYGVIRRLAATALPRWLLVTGRLVAVLGVVVVQVVVLTAIALALGWRPAVGGVGWAVLLVLLGCVAFGALGIFVGGTLRAEVTLAVANLIWLVLVFVGGIVVPIDEMPRGLAAVAQWLPTAALADGLRTSLATGAPDPSSRCWSWRSGRCWRAPRRSGWSAGADAGRLASTRGPARPSAAHLTARHAHAGGRRRGRAGGHRRHRVSRAGHRVRVGLPDVAAVLPGQPGARPAPRDAGAHPVDRVRQPAAHVLVVSSRARAWSPRWPPGPDGGASPASRWCSRSAWSRRPSSVG